MWCETPTKDQMYTFSNPGPERGLDLQVWKPLRHSLNSWTFHQVGELWWAGSGEEEHENTGERAEEAKFRERGAGGGVRGKLGV